MLRYSRARNVCAKAGPALRNTFKNLITIFPAVAEVVEVSCNSMKPGSVNAVDQVWHFRKDTDFGDEHYSGCQSRRHSEITACLGQ